MNQTLTEASLWELGKIDLSSLTKGRSDHFNQIAMNSKLAISVMSYVERYFPINRSRCKMQMSVGGDGPGAVDDFHHDGDGWARIDPDKYYLFMWADKQGTELKRRNQDGYATYYLKSGVAYLMDNMAWVHRRPDEVDKDRLFVRMYIPK